MTISIRRSITSDERDGRSGSNTPLATDEDLESSIEMQEVHHDDREDEIKPSSRSLFAFTTRKHTLNIFSCIVFAIASGVLKPVAAIFYGNIFASLTDYGGGAVTAKETLVHVSKWCFALTILGLVVWVVEGLFLCSWMVFGELQAKSVRENMFVGMLDKDLEWYDLRKDGIGSLLIRIETQIRELQLSVSQPLGFLLFETAGAVASLGTALYYSWNLTLVIMATFPIAGIALWLISLKLGPAIEAQKRELTHASKLANTAVTAIDTVKAFNGQDQEIWQYLSAIRKSTIYYMIQARCNALQFGITKAIMVGIFVQGFWYGITLVNNGMDPGRVVTTFYACLTGMQAIDIILPQWLVLAKGMSAGATLKSIMNQVDRGGNVHKIEGSIKPSSIEGNIEINDVTFAYPSNRGQNVLDKTTFFFPAGETTFVVGKSGSGKSTLGNLLLKFYEPQAGKILMDGHPMQDLDTDWVRKNITLVLQQSVVFNETIRKNVEFGKEGDSNEQDILNACEEMSLDEVLAGLPLGLDTVVGSRERQLSGGQKQRIALARARLRDAPILVLDEGTSALDHKCGVKVLDNIREWRQGKTTIIITHDISQILDEDYVYVMEHSRVVQEGYRSKLSAKANGTFATFSTPEQRPSRFSPTSEERPPRSSSTDTIRRKSAPATPTSSHFSIASTLYDRKPVVSPPIAPPIDRRIMEISNRRLSLGFAAAFANELKAETIWTSPTIDSPRARFEDFERPSPRRHISHRTQNTHNRISYSPSPTRYHDDNPLAVSGFSSIQLNERGNKSTKKKRPIPINTKNLEVPSPESESASNLTMEKPQTIITSEEIPPNKPKPSPEEVKPASLTHILGTVWPTLNSRDRTILICGFIAAFVVATATPACAIIFARLLQTFYEPINRSAEARKWSLALLGVALLDGVACFCSHYALEHSGQAWVNALRVEALKRVLGQPKSWFEESRNSPGKLNEVLDRNAEEMRNLVGRFAGSAFTAFWMLFICLIWAFVNTWKLTLVSIASGPVVFAVTRAFNAVSAKWEHRCNKASTISSVIFSDTFSNIKVVRAFTLETYFKNKHYLATNETYSVGRKRANWSGALFGLTDAMSFFITATIFYYATVLITQGSITVAIALQTVNLLLFGIANSTNMLAMIPQINSSRTTATHMLQLANLDPKDSHENSSGGERLESIFPIKFQGLDFTYPARPERKTLEGINLTILPNTTTALVGASGSGKSTLTSLLINLYPPDPTPPSFTTLLPSPLTFSSHPIQNLHTPSLRTAISLVPQTPILFPTTIHQNIIYGLPSTSLLSTLPSVISAAKSAGIHTFISSLPSSYNTLIGEGGQTLSPGQAQRIVIARALVRKPKLLILDEATSGLDGEGAEVVRETVGKLKSERGMATVVVSHSFEMMGMADGVVVLEKGRVVEVGGVEELRGRKGGVFWGLFGGEREVADQDLNDVGNGEGNSEQAVFTREWEISRPATPKEKRTIDSWYRQKSI